MTPGQAALAGFQARATPALIPLLRRDPQDTAARVIVGWPGDTLTPADLPRLTLFLVADTVIRPGMHLVRIQTDIWAPARDWTKLGDLDAQVLALFDEQHWAHQGVRLYATALPGRDFPGAPDRYLRRSRDFRVQAG